MPRAVAVVAPIGPNPAALTELVWGLVRLEGLAVSQVHVVLESAEAWGFLDDEVTAPGAAWDQLRALLGGAVPQRDALRISLAQLPDGGPPAHAREPGIVEAMREPLWSAALAAQAGGPALVFALSGGRWRASTALAATVFQLLARPGDRLVDVRISDPVASGGTGFFFPEQPDRPLWGTGKHQGRPFRARDIQVLLEPVAVPRLRPLLGEQGFETFGDALAASDRAIAAARGPRIHLDLKGGALRVEGHSLKLSANQFALYAVLATAAVEGAPWVHARDLKRVGDQLRAWKASYSGRELFNHVAAIDRGQLQKLVDGESIPEEDHNLFVQLWSKLRGRLEALLPQGDPLLRRAIPQRRSSNADPALSRIQWALEIPPDRITIAE